MVYLQQKQPGKAFTLPMVIDIYTGGKIESHKIRMDKKFDTLIFTLSARPDLLNVDASKTLLLSKTDRKSLDQYAFQYAHAPLYIDRYEALEAAIKNKAAKESQHILEAALRDKFYKIKMKAIQALDLSNEDTISRYLKSLKDIAINDSNNQVRAAAIIALSESKMSDHTALFKKSLHTESYAIQAAALNALGKSSPSEALLLARPFERDKNKAISDVVLSLYTTYGGNDQWSYIYDLFQSLTPPKRNNIIQQFARLTGQVESAEFAIQGIVAIQNLGILAKQYGLAPKYIELLNEIKRMRLLLNDPTSVQQVNEAIIEIEKH